jgi:hypothetical protein
MAWQDPNNPQNRYQGPQGGAYTSGGPPEVGSTYGRYTPTSFAQQGQQTSFGGQTAGQTTWAAPSTGNSVQQQVGQQATPESWNQSAAQPRTAAAAPAGATGASSTTWTQSWPGASGAQASTPPPFGGWNQQQAQRAAGPENPSQAIADAYLRYLGRPASQEEIAARVKTRGFNLEASIEGIARSPEAYAYWQRQQQGGGAPAQGGQPAQGGPALDSRGWDTDQYEAPRYIAQRPSSQPPAGWDREKWNNPAHQTPKYVVGRILSQYPPSIENLGRAAAEIAAAYPGTTFNGKDKINVPGVGTIDALGNSGTGDPSKMLWRYGADDGADGGGSSQQSGYYDPMQQMMQLLMQQGYLNAQGGYAQDPRQAQEMAAMRKQLADFQKQNDLYKQQQATQQAQQAAAEQAQRNRGPQFSYF